MIELLTMAIGVGLAVSLFFSEIFGLAAGGMVVPGYFALYLNRPVDVFLTIMAAMITYLIVYLLSTFIIVYGRRRTVLMILVGYIVRMLINFIPFGPLTTIPLFSQAEFTVIGFIIPGLIAIWIDRQGIVETLSALAAAAVAIRLILILVVGSDLQLV